VACRPHLQLGGLDQVLDVAPAAQTLGLVAAPGPLHLILRGRDERVGLPKVVVQGAEQALDVGARLRWGGWGGELAAAGHWSLPCDDREHRRAGGCHVIVRRGSVRLAERAGGTFDDSDETVGPIDQSVTYRG
jgi:hypothetical protein